MFDAYYVLVRAQALPFLENMDVTYADGSVMSVSGDEVRAQAKSGAADSVRMDSESNPYFRLNLLRLEDGEHVPDYGKDSGDAYSYRDPFSAYETDAMPKGVQLVESVSYTLSINQCQYTDAINQAGDGRGNTANLPDYGTWFGDSLQYDNPDWINLMSFEVTGRFYKTCDNRQSVTTVTVRAGGDYSGNNRAGHKAVTRYDDGSGTSSHKSEWSYDNRKWGHKTTYSHVDYEGQMSHLQTISQVSVIDDGNYVRKGVNTDLAYELDVDDSVKFADDQKFYVSFYRKHTNNLVSLSGSDYNDWNYGRISFADRVVLQDTFPVCFPNDELGYYGFLSTGIGIPADSGVLSKLQSQLAKQQGAVAPELRLTTKQWQKDESAVGGYAENEGAARTIAVTTKGTFERDASGAERKLSDETIADLLDATAADGTVYVQFARPDEEPAVEIKSMVETGGKPFVIDLHENEFIAELSIELGAYAGDVDGAGETDQRYNGEADGTETDIDLHVLGRPYVYGSQENPLTGGATAVSDATNTVSAISYLNEDPDTPISSPAWNYYDNHDRSSDPAAFTGYLIPLRYRYTLHGENDVTDTLCPVVYDFNENNDAPTKTIYEARFQNVEDGTPGVDDAKRASHISHVTLTSALDDNSRLQTVYVPQRLVPGGQGYSENWLRVVSLSFVANGKTVELSWEDLVNAGVVSSQANAKGDYEVDLEAYLRQDLKNQLDGDPDTVSQELVTTYKATTDTNSINGYKDDPAVDVEYAKAHVSSISLTFDSPNADRYDPTTMLDSGKYLANEEGGYAFSYECVLVDRTLDAFQNSSSVDEGWDRLATPTFSKQVTTSYTYASISSDATSIRHDLSVSNVETKDPNHNIPSAASSDPTFFYHARHRLGLLEMSMARGTKITVEGADGSPTERTLFAYDRDDRSLASPSSADPLAGEPTNIPDRNLYAGDYVEYTLTIQAGEDAGLPLEQATGRFSVAAGQRIVGWEVADDSTAVGADGAPLPVTAKIGSVEGGAQGMREAPAQEDLSVAEGQEQYEQNRELVLTVGDASLSPDNAQMQQGTFVNIRVITQLTSELGDDGYDSEEGVAFQDDEPAWKGKSPTAQFMVTAAPKHGFAQYRVRDVRSARYPSKQMNALYGTSTSYNTSYRTDDGSSSTSFYREITQDSRLDGQEQLGIRATSALTFYTHYEYRYSNARIAAEWLEVDPNAGSSATVEKNPADTDGNPMKLTVSDLKNPTYHVEDMTVTVLFTKDHDEKGNPVGAPIFELTDTPKLASSVGSADGLKDVGYPEGIVESEAGPDPDTPGRPDVKVEYYEPSQGAWLEYDALETLMKQQGPAETDHVVNDSVFRTATGVRWTYYDVPARAEGDAGEFLLDDVALIGVGRYHDVRLDEGTVASKEQATSWNFDQYLDVSFTHRHNESEPLFSKGSVEVEAAPALHGTWLTKQDDYNDYVRVTVSRRTPVMQFHNQVFQTQEQAAAGYDAEADQKLGYIPGETFWYKDTLRNVKEGTNPGVSDLQGELYNPVFYERIPANYLKQALGAHAGVDITAEYLESYIKQHLRWTDRDGNDVTAARTTDVGMELSVELADASEAPDYGGAMTYASTSEVSTPAGGKPFADLNPTDSGVSENTTFYLFKISWEPAAGTEGGNPADATDLAPVDRVKAGNTRMEVGDTIELWFPVQAALDGLPQVYTDLDQAALSSGTTGAEPAYFPRLGEYSANSYSSYYYSHYADPLGGEWFTSTALPSYYAAIKVNTSNVLMDLDSLLHESGFTGDRPDDTDLWETFDGSLAYLPGDNSDNDDSFFDTDMRTLNNCQTARYSPQRPNDATTESWPEAKHYTRTDTSSSSTHARYALSFDKLCLTPRIGALLENETEVPVVWSQTRVHLQKAWIATASEFAVKGDDPAMDNGSAPNYESARVYESGRDPHCDYAGNPTWWDDDNRGVLWGQHTTALQYNQDFTARLQALNYGDRTLDGVEFTYVLPRGVEPVFADDGSMVEVDAKVLEQAVSAANPGTDPYAEETWNDIPDDLVKVEVVQRPDGDYEGYDAPSAAQDPAAYRDGKVLKANAEDLSADLSMSSYEAVAAAAGDAESYRDSSQPWVLKITVEQPLGKWFYRAQDGSEVNTADPDGYADGGYKINVDVPVHVFANNANGEWNDRVLVRPVDTSRSEGMGSRSSAYYQVFDIDHWEGATAQADKAHNVQPYGMDWRWSSYYGTGRSQLYGSPNMPAVNGKTVQNNTVSADDLSVKVANTSAIAWGKAYKDAGSEAPLYAQTGTTAVQREPLVRVWNTLGENGVSGSVADYYLMQEADHRQLNVHVENRYWWNDIQKTSYQNHYHNYATDGGARGDLVLPVVTTVLPQGIAPVDRDTGLPYSPSPDVEQNFDQADWGVSYTDGATANEPDANAEDMQPGFRATVTYEKVTMTDTDGDTAASDGEEYRYVVRFLPQDDDLDAPDGAVGAGNSEQRIKSDGAGLFSFDIVTYEEPVREEGDPEQVENSYENVRSYVSSAMGGYRFISDTDIGGNPYLVGAEKQSSGDLRLDARASKDYPTAPVPSNCMADEGTREEVPFNWLPGFSGTYAEMGDMRNTTANEEGDVSLGDVVEREGLPLLVEDYAFRPAWSLTEENTQALDGDDAAVYQDAFSNRAAGSADQIPDAGSYAALKLRTSYPSFTSSYEVEADPVRPLDGADPSATGTTNTGDGAKGDLAGGDGEVLDADGGKTGEADQSWQYGDEPWYALTVKNNLADEENLGSSGALAHGKLVFSFHLPEQVTFYNKATLDSNNYADYEDDDYQFFVERTYTPRGQTDQVIETLTPKQLRAAGWTVNVTAQPDYGANNYSDPDYAKPDYDDPDDAGAGSTAKPKSHEGEVLVVELAPPDDATDAEFDGSNSMLEAYWKDGIRPDGYFGMGDVITQHAI